MSSNLRFPMVKGLLFLSFLIIQATFGAALLPLYISGPDNNRLKLVIMGDGFDTSNQDEFNHLSDTLISGFFQFHPWKTYHNFVNFYRINTISHDSGISIDYLNISKSTTFNTHITENFYIQASTDQIRDTLTSFFPDWNILSQRNYCFFIANAQAGAGNELNPDIGAFDRIFDDIYYNGIHEMGHGFADLADEYVQLGGQAGSDIEPNVSFTFNRDSIKWNTWIKAATPLPTPGNWFDALGAFEGAKYQQNGIYRPESNCMMRDANHQYCRICTEAIVLQLHRKLKMYDSYYPNWSPVNFKDTPDTFRLAMVDTTNLQFSVKWYFDNVEIPGAHSFTYILDPGQHSLGTSAHQIKCRFRDTTSYIFQTGIGGAPKDTCPFVRTDPDSVMTDSVVWNLKYDIAVENTHFILLPSTFSVAVAPSGVRITANPYGRYQIAAYDLRGRLLSTLAGGTTYGPIEQTYRPKANGLIIVRMVTPKGVHAAKAVWAK